ncbi:P-loop containing nucleoside triphosphate hydrolase protein [Chaetomium sp. MPI-SDFR-AT-0129]|uniref:P-loop containing nucleoside triphosphate hydrolase protein n=1 Tax=Dichotomopilus funicola TaxID=1934379 RepID=A0AAN6UWL3_9PEZI|nr:P-loop containing nucleoside triphosphate hydrolase protein [Chaetomium sp. MPI-SDFR-AT-0129]KAK4139860.1 P-loop containing nucleoside triphosphate hydrolase protein [Dichotomopilus funicola]
MPRDPLIGLVGKPSAGKSSTLNSLTDASSKVGNFPFTTIDPQRAIGYLQIDCACARHNVTERCKPNYGACVNGRRSVPIELLDVAGLVPGAHQGKGLGNKFLDDLRHADALIHVVDVSGTTDAEGKNTRGYDPSVDIAWLRSEIVAWIRGNLMDKWGSIKRRHIAVKATAVETLQNQFSGYGSTSSVVARTLDRLGLKEPLEDWSDETIDRVVNAFTDEKFPTVIALNKIDHPDADKNIAKIAKMQDPNTIVLCSAISEIFLRKLAKQGYIRYTEGSEFVDTREDLIADGDPDGGGLKDLDDKNRARIENLKDMVLYRFGSTGVVQVLSKAAEILGLVPVFPVRNTTTFGSGSADSKAVFRDCVLVKKNSTVADVGRKIMGDAPIAYIEGAGGIRVADDQIVGVGKNDILSFKVGK